MSADAKISFKEIQRRMSCYGRKMRNGRSKEQKSAPVVTFQMASKKIRIDEKVLFLDLVYEWSKRSRHGSLLVEKENDERMKKGVYVGVCM